MGRCEPEKIMSTKCNTRPRVLPVILLLFTACPLLAQMTPAQRLTQAFVLEKEGKPVPAIAELQALLDSQALDTLRPVKRGTSWDSLMKTRENFHYLDMPMKSPFAF